MIRRWNELIDYLKINEEKLGETERNLLLKWCKDNVSIEKEFHGNPNEFFYELRAYLQTFFDNIGPYLLDEPTEKHKSLKNMSVIQYAAMMGYDQLINKLLSNSSNVQQVVNDVTSSQMSALHFSALFGHVKSSQILLEHGADVTLQSKLKQNPLHLSLTIPSFSPETIKAKKHFIFNEIRNSNLKINLLDSTDISGTTIAHLASQNGFTEIIKLLLEENQALFEKTDNFQKTALHLALINKSYQSVKILASIDSLLLLSDSDGMLPMHYAAQYGNLEMLQLCMIKNVDERDHYSRTALHFAAQAGHKEQVEYLVSKGANVTGKDVYSFGVLHHAVVSGNYELVKWLLENTTVDINQLDQMNRSPLIYLLTNNTEINQCNERMISLLIDMGADLGSPDNTGRSAKKYLTQLLKDKDEMHPLIVQSISESKEMGGKNSLF